ncbi:CREB/ATF bZIP transcription factor [Pimephales promelas]|nr:CREB/ATF bZIP transcription factor [Pimephales promelas]
MLDVFGNFESQINNEVNQSAVLDVPVSRNRGLVQRSKLQDVSGRIINKNAVAARINRLKKKEYVTGLEQRVGSLTTENRVLKQENGNLNKRVEDLENETRYLRAVLANESMLAQLLSRLSGVNGMKFSTSLFQESNENDHDYAMPRKRVKVEDKDTAGGVCLHVDKDHVSVEFCTKCLVRHAGRLGHRTSMTAEIHVDFALASWPGKFKKDSTFFALYKSLSPLFKVDKEWWWFLPIRCKLQNSLRALIIQ